MLVIQEARVPAPPPPPAHAKLGVHPVCAVWQQPCFPTTTCFPIQTTSPLKTRLCFVKDVFLAPKLQHSGVGKEPNSCHQTTHSDTGRMGNNTKWAPGHRAEIMTILPWVRKEPGGPAFWRITVMQCPSKPIRGGHGEENPFGRRVLQKLSSPLPPGMSLGSGYCLCVK